MQTGRFEGGVASATRKCTIVPRRYLYLQRAFASEGVPIRFAGGQSQRRTRGRKKNLETRGVRERKNANRKKREVSPIINKSSLSRVTHDDQCGARDRTLVCPSINLQRRCAFVIAAQSLRNVWQRRRRRRRQASAKETGVGSCTRPGPPIVPELPVCTAVFRNDSKINCAIADLSIHTFFSLRGVR